MEKLDLKTVINTGRMTGVLNHEQEVFLKKQQHGKGLYHAVLGHWFFVERTNDLIKDIKLASYNLEMVLIALDVKAGFKDLTPLEAFPINRIKTQELSKERLTTILFNTADLLNNFVMICGYDCLTKALYEATQNDLLKDLFIKVSCTPKQRKTDYQGMYESDYYLNNVEAALQFLTAQINELKSRVKTPFVMFNYKGYLPTKTVIKEAILDLDGTDYDTAAPHHYVEHIKHRYTKDSDRYMGMFGINPWLEFTDRFGGK